MGENGLQQLNISCNHISSNAFDSLVSMLKHNSSLHSLNVSGNPLVTANSSSSTGSRSMTASHSTMNSRPASRLSHAKATATSSDGSLSVASSSKLQTYRSGYGHSESKMYAKALEDCLLNDNASIVVI